MEILGQFGVQPLLLLAQVINFLILFFVLRKFLYAPILKILAERRERIAKGLEQARESEVILAQAKKTREQEIHQAHQEAQSIIKQATDTASSIVQEAQDKTKAEVKAMMVAFQQELAREKEQVWTDVKTRVAELVVLSLEKVTGQTLTKATQKETIKRAVRELHEQQTA